MSEKTKFWILLALLLASIVLLLILNSNANKVLLG
jgi:hypothetical protein